MDRKKIPEMSVYSQVSLNTMLKDVRFRTRSFKFGTIEHITKQYGIKYKELENCMEFTAPKSRLQIFVEKLHFAAVPYSRKPY